MGNGMKRDVFLKKKSSTQDDAKDWKAMVKHICLVHVNIEKQWKTMHWNAKTCSVRTAPNRLFISLLKLYDNIIKLNSNQFLLIYLFIE